MSSNNVTSFLDDLPDDQTNTASPQPDVQINQALSNHQDGHNRDGAQDKSDGGTNNRNNDNRENNEDKEGSNDDSGEEDNDQQKSQDNSEGSDDDKDRDDAERTDAEDDEVSDRSEASDKEDNDSEKLEDIEKDEAGVKNINSEMDFDLQFDIGDEDRLDFEAASFEADELEDVEKLPKIKKKVTKPAQKSTEPPKVIATTKPVEEKMSVRRKMLSKLPDDPTISEGTATLAMVHDRLKELDKNQASKKSEEKITFKVEAVKKRAYRKGSGDDSPESKKPKQDDKVDVSKDNTNKEETLKDDRDKKSGSKSNDVNPKPLSEKVEIDEDAVLTSHEAKMKEERIANTRKQERQRDEARKLEEERKEKREREKHKRRRDVTDLKDEVERSKRLREDRHSRDDKKVPEGDKKARSSERRDHRDERRRSGDSRRDQPSKKSHESDRKRSHEGDRKKSHEVERKKSLEGETKKSHEGETKKSHEAERKKLAEGDRKKSHEGERKKLPEGDRKKSHEGERKKLHDGDRKKSHEVDRKNTNEGEGKKSLDDEKRDKKCNLRDDKNMSKDLKTEDVSNLKKPDIEKSHKEFEERSVKMVKSGELICLLNSNMNFNDHISIMRIYNLDF